MKLLIVADHRDPLVYSPNVKERFGDVSLILGAGDLRMEYYSFIVSSLNKSLYFVFGNHCLEHYGAFKKRRFGHFGEPLENLGEPYENSFGAICIEDKVIRHKPHNLLIAGIGGSKRYNQGESQFSELQIYLRFLKMLPRLFWNKLFHGRYLDILLTHAAPFGIHDKQDPCHVGFKSFLWFMDKFKPRYLLHGHIHLYSLNDQRVSQYGETIIINSYGHYLLEIDHQEGG